MSISVTINGTSYTIPQNSETGWGTQVTSWISAVSNSTLQKNGGLFTLTADSDFGASFGLKSLYYKSRATNPAASGVVRLGNTEGIGFRNAANSADLLLAVNASNQLTYNGNVIDGATALSPSLAVVTDGSGIVTTSATTAAQIAALSTSATANQVLATPSGSSGAPSLRALVGADLPTPSASTLGGIQSTTGTTHQWVSSISTSGVPGLTQPAFTDISGTASLTSQVTGLLPLANGGTNANLTAANGAIPYSTGSAIALLAPGTSGNVLTSGGAGAPTWTSPLVNPMTTGGDMIYGGSAGAATRLANGTAGQHLLSAGGTAAPVWTSINSSIYVDTGNGHGSTNTKVRRYTNTRLSQGSDITYADSATNGASFTINTAGVYFCKMEDQISAGQAVIGITVNGSALTTNIDSITYAQGRRAVAFSAANNSIPSVSCTIVCAANDVIRPGDDGTNNDTAAASNFLITRVA